MVTKDRARHFYQNLVLTSLCFVIYILMWDTYVGENMKSLDPLTEVAKWRISLAGNHLDFPIPPELI